MAKRIREKAQKRIENKDKRPFAIAKHIRISPSKMNLTLSTIRGKDVSEALAILKFLPNGASEVAYKVLASAIANAENNKGYSREELVVSEAYATPGPTLKRMWPRSHGSADRILKRTCHVTVKLDKIVVGGAK
jgi:large subunit ribosomal protein L22